MVVDKYVGRCLDVGSTPTGSIIPLHSFAFRGKTLLNQRFRKVWKGLETKNGAGGSRTHVQTPANTFVYDHRPCLHLT